MNSVSYWTTVPSQAQGDARRMRVHADHPGVNFDVCNDTSWMEKGVDSSNMC